jgi:hypothetical protein
VAIPATEGGKPNHALRLKSGCSTRSASIAAFFNTIDPKRLFMLVTTSAADVAEADIQ